MDRDLKQRQCQIIGGRVRGVTLPALAESAQPDESVCTACHKQLINSATSVNQKINCPIRERYLSISYDRPSSFSDFSLLSIYYASFFCSFLESSRTS